jgi:hypothetical protein
MHRFALACAIAALALPEAALAAPDGVPARPRTIGSWGWHDPVQPDPGYEPWTPRDVAGFLQLHPDAFVDLGYDDGKPAGHSGWKASGALVDELQSIAAQRGVPTRHRLCTSERPDVLVRYAENAGGCNPSARGGGCDWEGDMDGTHGESETVVKVARRATAGTPDALADTTQRWAPDLYVHRLLVLRPGAATEERRRVTRNEPSLLFVDQPWNVPPRPGDAYEVRGSFDPAWVKQVSRAAHTETLQRFWLGTARNCGGVRCNGPAEPLDPYHPDNRRGWQPWVDRTALEALATATTLPALYGVVNDAGRDPSRAEDPYFAANSVVMDLANPEYRAWRARYLLYKLEDYGIRPGDGACLLMAYKPGLHTHYDPAVYGPPTHHCHEPGTETWAGPAHVCRDGTEFGGPFDGSPFAAGEYEAGVNAFLRELYATLAASGHADARIVTVEAPGIGDRDWAILADDVRRHRMLYGEAGSWIEPTLASLAALPAPTASTPEPPAAPEPEPAPAPEPTAAPTSPAPSGGGTTASAPVSGGGGGGTSASGGPSGSGSAAANAPPTGRRAPRAGFVASSTRGGGDGTVEAPQD